MPYTRHFQLTDDLIQHLDPVLMSLHDPWIETRYTGFLAVSSVTVLELALKTIFCDFGARKHVVLGTFTSSYFEKINGRIALGVITKEYIPRFGEKYLQRFERQLKALENTTLRSNGYSLKSSYGNLVAWRHAFAHEGVMPPNASYAEVKRGYESGKHIMNCLATSMHR